jgi:hypothetical protein
MKAAPPPSRWLTSPFPASVTVEPIRVRAGIYPSDEKERLRELFDERGLARVLNDNHVFARTDSGYGSGVATTFVLRGDVVSRWNPRGVANFFIWFPGGLVFAPNWYGTRMEYFADASVDLISVESGERLATYQTSVAYQVIHRSGSPGPFFGALIIVPNVVRGARASRPRELYTGLLYPAAFDQLWEEIAAQIVQEREGFFASRARVQRERCGGRLDQPPQVGDQWSEFVSCQSSYYVLAAEVQLAEGSAKVFVQTENGGRISVVGDEIVRWEQPVLSPVSAPPPRR